MRYIGSDKSFTIELSNELQAMADLTKDIKCSQIANISTDHIAPMQDNIEVGYSPNMMINSYDVDKLQQMINYLKMERREAIDRQYALGSYDFGKLVQEIQFDEETEIENSKNKTVFSFRTPPNFDGRNSFVQIINDGAEITSSINKNKRGRVGYFIKKNENNILFEVNHYTSGGKNLTFDFTVYITYWRRV